MQQKPFLQTRKFESVFTLPECHFPLLRADLLLNLSKKETASLADPTRTSHKVINGAHSQ